MGDITWLASYPKSGNTWVRIFLCNLIRNSSSPADINDVDEVGIAASRALFDAYAGVEASDLTASEVEDLRPLVYEQIAEQSNTTAFLKIHDAFAATLATPAHHRSAIYIVRNPLDVAVSFSHHSALPVDAILDRMSDESFVLEDRDDRPLPQLPQRLGSWSSHANAWADASMRLLVIRYEDLIDHPIDTFGSIARFSGIPHTKETLERAVQFSEFGQLQKQEAISGFRTGSNSAKRFFRRGQAGGWRDDLTDAQIRRVVEEHGATMKRFGYGEVFA